MKPADLVVSVLSALPDKKVEGRKRLQKLCYLVNAAGTSVDAEFEILHYGPFSKDIAAAADRLVLSGVVEEDFAPIGVYGTYQYIYRLKSAHQKGRMKKDGFLQTVCSLNKFSTVDLEVASTIVYFKKQGVSKATAVAQTRKMKPAKTTERTLRTAEKILGIVGCPA